MKIYHVRENARIAQPIPTEELVVDGRFDVYREVQEKEYLFLFLTSRGVVVQGLQYVGTIPLNDRVTILVEPKVGISNLLEMLRKAGGEYATLAVDRLYGVADEAPPEDIFALMAYAFLRELQNIEKFGLIKGYQSSTGSDSNLRGRLLLHDTIKRNWARGALDRMTYKFYEYTPDNIENRAIKYTLWILSQSINGMFLSAENRRLLGHFSGLFARASLDKSKSFLSDLQHRLKLHSIPPERAYYNPALQLCVLIIGGSTIAPDRDDRDLQLPAYLVRMSDVFERYVRQVLAEELLHHPTMRVLPKERGVISLFQDNPEPEVEPDIVITERGQPTVVCDVKYKEGATREDYSQVVTYALSHGSTRGALICATDAGQPRSEYKGGIGGIRIRNFYFSLRDLATSQEELGQFIVQEPW